MKTYTPLPREPSISTTVAVPPTTRAICHAGRSPSWQAFARPWKDIDQHSTRQAQALANSDYTALIEKAAR